MLGIAPCVHKDQHVSCIILQISVCWTYETSLFPSHLLGHEYKGIMWRVKLLNSLTNTSVWVWRQLSDKTY